LALHLLQHLHKSHGNHVRYAGLTICSARLGEIVERTERQKQHTGVVAVFDDKAHMLYANGTQAGAIDTGQCSHITEEAYSLPLHVFVRACARCHIFALWEMVRRTHAQLGQNGAAAGVENSGTAIRQKRQITQRA
jgi:hypothetical protein